MTVNRRFTAAALALVVAIPLLVAAREQATSRHFPPAGEWARRDPAALGLDAAKLDAAIQAALASENANTKDLAVDIPNSFRSEAPFNNLIGPTQTRAGANLVVIYKGYAVAASGDTARADMTFSVTKTFLSTVVGEAYERGLIKDLNDKAAAYMPKGVDLFTSEHNAKITWDHLLRQTSDWSGTLWGKPDWADRPPQGQTPEQWEKRELVEPGTRYKYNDTRVNVLALATLYLFKEALPAVLKREIMDPIGASSTWHWEPYENAYVTIDGKRMPSIPGGGHHGGGMFISGWDMARFGYLFLNNGRWGSRQLVTENWITMARTPGVNQGYGFMNWYFNANRPNRVSFQGNGPNTIYIDWEHDLVVVTRWLRGGNAFVDAVIAAKSTQPDFSGVWVAVTGPNAGAPGAEIHIKQTAQTITIGHPAGEHGPSHNPVYKLDGVEAKQPNLAHPQETDITKASWDGNRLIIVVQPERGGAQHKRVLSLQPDGTLAMEVTMTAAGRPEETIKATFRKK